MGHVYKYERNELFRKLMFLSRTCTRVVIIHLLDIVDLTMHMLHVLLCQQKISDTCTHTCTKHGI